MRPLLAGRVACGQTPEKAFEKDIEAYRATVRIPRLAVAVVKDNKIVYIDEFGSASDLENKIPRPGRHSLFRIASISKSFTATSMLQLGREKALRWIRT